MKRFLLVLLVFLLVLPTAGCDLIGGTPTNIDLDKSEKLRSFLQERYELTLPEDYVFLGGIFDHAFRDPGMTVIFEIKKADLPSMFSENWQKVEGEELYPQDFNSGYKDYLPITSFQSEGEWEYNSEMFTWLLYTPSDEDSYLCAFEGHHPGTSF